MGRQSMWDKSCAPYIKSLFPFFISFFWLYKKDKLVRLSVSKTLQSLDIPPSFVELKRGTYLELCLGHRNAFIFFKTNKK
jgi:hypothetical protein